MSASAAEGPQLVVLGNLLLDDVVLADGTTRMGQAGGAALYAALGAALWGIRVGIVTRIGDDYPENVLETLAARGIEVAGEGGRGRPTLRTWLLYEGRRRRVVHRLDGPTHDEVSPRADEIPPDWRPAALHLAPMPWTVQCELIQVLTAREQVRLSADPYELLTDDDLAQWRQVFGRVDALFLSEDEMQVTGGLEEPAPVLSRLTEQTPRLREVFYKRGERGGLVWEPATETLGSWDAAPVSVVDPTGAGDAFAGGVLAGRILGEPLTRRLDRGLVSAGFALAADGARGLLSSARDEAEARLLTRGESR